MENRVIIFDTTLRDGEQSPGATLTSSEKLEIAHQLARLGVDVIEAGFPAASPDDLKAVNQIAKTVGKASENEPNPPVICGLARAKTSDIDKAWEAVKDADKPRIHTFIATSDIHLKYKLKMTREEVIQTTREMVTYAHSLCPDIEFSPEDAGRSDPEYLYQVLAAAIECGATTLNIPDTVGYTTPSEFGDLIAGIKKNTKGIENCIISVHCHNDLGLATANSLSGVISGARQVEVAINGIGERAGNTALEEIVMALSTREKALGFSTGIDTTQITRTSKMVSNFTGIPVQPNKAIVGANAFAHEAGIHQDGILKNQQTYEIMLPESVGASKSNLVLGKHSGRHALKNHLVEMGYELDENELSKIFERFKKLADKKKNITDADLEALISDEVQQQSEYFKLDGLQVACGTMGMPTASVRLIDSEGIVHTIAEIGTGPVDATYKAISSIIDIPNELTEFAIHAITEGIDALGEVTVRIQAKNGSSRLHAHKESEKSRTFGGYGADTDIIVASAKAYLSALNKLINFKNLSQNK